MEAASFRRSFEDEPMFRALLLRYDQVMHAQVMQTAACNVRHQLEQRLARWLLMALDRSKSNELGLTQEFLSMMLGVHRPGVTVAAIALQNAGTIRYARGHITVTDRQALEAASCDCYASVKRRFDLLKQSGLSGSGQERSVHVLNP